MESDDERMANLIANLTQSMILLMQHVKNHPVLGYKSLEVADFASWIREVSLRDRFCSPREARHNFVKFKREMGDLEYLKGIENLFMEFVNLKFPEASTQIIIDQPEIPLTQTRRVHFGDYSGSFLGELKDRFSRGEVDLCHSYRGEECITIVIEPSLGEASSLFFSMISADELWDDKSIPKAQRELTDRANAFRKQLLEMMIPSVNK